MSAGSLEQQEEEAFVLRSEQQNPWPLPPPPGGEGRSRPARARPATPNGALVSGDPILLHLFKFALKFRLPFHFFLSSTNVNLFSIELLSIHLIHSFLCVFMSFEAYKSKTFGFSTFISHYFHT